MKVLKRLKYNSTNKSLDYVLQAMIRIDPLAKEWILIYRIYTYKAK